MSRSSNTPATPVQKGCRSVFLGLFGVMGLALLVPIGGAVVQTVRTYFWKATPCIVVESRRVEAGPEASSGSEDFKLSYRYVVDGRQRTSSRFSSGMQESLSGRKLEQLLWRYPVGAEAKCYVNPKDPNDSVFQRGSLLVFLLLLFPLIFIAVGVGGVIATWRPQLFTRRLKPDSTKRGFGTGAAILFFGVFTLVGAGFFYFVTVRPLLTYLAARSWPEVPCEIVSSSVGSHTSTSGSGSNRSTSTTYSVDIVYRYQIGGREYRSDRYEVMGGSSSGRKGKEAAVARYPSGSKTLCYVNPSDPTDALLHRGLSWFMLIGLLPLLFLLIGLGGFFGLIRSALKDRGSVALRGTPSLPVQPSLPTVSGPGGSTILTPSSSPMAKLVGAIFVAVFWNGITGIFVGIAVKSWRSQQPEIFLSLILIPFVLVGIALLGFVGMTFLNLFNPRIALAVNSQSIPLGGTLDVRWNFRGAVSRIRHLRIFLEGREEATYRRGTRTSTDREVFARLPIIETAEPLRIRDGSAQLVIPDRLMHTWDGGSNEIVWELKVAGEIPRYPDVSEDFHFTVLPHTR